jgi:hypothetical protein
MLALCTVHRQAIYITDSTRTGIFPEEVWLWFVLLTSILLLLCLWLDVAIVLLAALLKKNPYGSFLHSSKILARSQDKNGGGYIPSKQQQDLGTRRRLYYPKAAVRGGVCSSISRNVSALDYWPSGNIEGYIVSRYSTEYVLR